MAELATDTDLYGGALLAIDFTKYQYLSPCYNNSFPAKLICSGSNQLPESAFISDIQCNLYKWGLYKWGYGYK